MSLPGFCYQKAFWWVVGITVMIMASTMGMVYAMVLDNQNRSIENEQVLAERRQDIDLIPKIYKNQIIICTSLGVSCD